MALIEVLDPTEEGPKEARTLAPRLEDLNGRTAGFRMQWTRFDVFMDRFEELFRERFAPREVLRLTGMHSSYFAGEKAKESDAFSSQVDWAIVGLAA